MLQEFKRSNEAEVRTERTLRLGKIRGRVMTEVGFDPFWWKMIGKYRTSGDPYLAVSRCIGEP